VRESFYGKRVIDVARLIIDNLGMDLDPQRWADERTAVFMELLEGGMELMPGMRDSLALFKELEFRTAVVSSGARGYVLRMLEITGLSAEFDAVVTGDDVSRGKPDPECFLKGAERLEVAPAGCVVLEDAWAGAAAGIAAGMKVINVRNRFSPVHDGSHAVLDSLAQVDRLLLERLGNGAS
jgi:HAD superfamily hydrolase (TIGR01509 family)